MIFDKKNAFYLNILNDILCSNKLKTRPFLDSLSEMTFEKRQFCFDGRFGNFDFKLRFPVEKVENSTQQFKNSGKTSFDRCVLTCGCQFWQDLLDP